MVPLSVRLPTGVTSSVTPPVTSVAATTGASLVPVMVTVTVCGRRCRRGRRSNVTVKVSILAVAAARYSTAVAAHAVVPGHHAAGAGAGGVGADDGRQGAERAAERYGASRRHAVHVGQIDVGEGDGAAVGQVANRGDQLGHAAGHVRRRRSPARRWCR